MDPNFGNYFRWVPDAEMRSGTTMFLHVWIGSVNKNFREMQQVVCCCVIGTTCFAITVMKAYRVIVIASILLSS